MNMLYFCYVVYMMNAFLTLFILLDLSDHLIYSIHQCWTTDSLAFDTDLVSILNCNV